MITAKKKPLKVHSIQTGGVDRMSECCYTEQACPEVQVN